jgi:S1-C subfamily serine protease
MAKRGRRVVIQMQQDAGYGQAGLAGQPGAPGPSWHLGGSYAPPPPRPARRSGLLSHLVVAVTAAALAAGVMAAVYHPAATGSSSPAALPGPAVVPSPAPAAGGSPAAGGEQQVVNKVEPGLVVIDTALQYNGEAAAGTGMVINPDGLVLTNNHVIEAATKISATVLATGRTYAARVVGYDKTGDIALIQLQGAPALHAVPLGNSSTVRAGAVVVAMGNADGQGTVIPTVGHVTGLGRTITAADEGGTATTEVLHGMIQTSADIVSGDSGGPLADAAGQVIGMDTAGSSVGLTQQATPAGFAIPIDTALSVARQIAAGHASSVISIGYPPFLGIFIGSGTSGNPHAQAQQQEQQNGFGDGFGGLGGFGGLFGPPPAPPACYTSNTGLTVPSSIAPVSAGTLVDGTICGSPAAAAGMTGGSVITGVNGKPTPSPAGLTATLGGLRPGDTITVSWVSPSGRHATTSIRLLAGPPQ